MRKLITVTLITLLCAAVAGAQVAKNSDHNLRPTGKGWAEHDANAPKEAPPGGAAGKPSSSNGINYHGGPIMPGTVNIYYIWYGNWNGGTHASDSQATVGLLGNFIGGLNGSGYEKINSTYYDGNNVHVTGNMVLANSTTDSYSGGTTLTDTGIKNVVTNAINHGLPKDTNGIYFVLTSSDVNESSGFCTQYCGWHTHGTINGSDIKYSFVGNPDRCPSACEWETSNSVNNNTGADGMASIIAHESEEAISDPDLNAWYDRRGAENADKCAWKFGPTQTTSTGAAYNQTLGNEKFLIQMNWENARGGGCDQTLGGPFYTQ